MEITPGQLVVSIAGRDKGKAFIVVGTEEGLHGTYVHVADGKQRKIHQPKRKNIKHVKATQLIDGEIRTRMENGSKITNQTLRRAIIELWSSYQENIETGEGGR